MLTGTTATRIARIARIARDAHNGRRLTVTGHPGLDRTVDLVLVVVGVQPDTALAQTAGVTLVIRGAVVVDGHMRTGVPDVYAAGTASIPTTGWCPNPATCRWDPQRTIRAGSPERTRWAATGPSSAASVPRS